MTATAGRPRAQGLGPTLRAAWTQSTFDVPPRAQWPRALRRTRLIVAPLFIAQLAGFIAWNTTQFHRFVFGLDFSTRLQWAYMVAHGVLNPYSAGFGYRALDDHGEFEMMLVGEIYRLWEHPQLLLWLQALCVVAAGWLAFEWVCDVAARHHAQDGRTALTVTLTALGALMLLSSPWTWWTISFDLHFEVAWGALFAIATARDLLAGRRRGWIWALLLIASGDVGATYLVMIGLGLALYGQRWWRTGLGLAVLGVAWAGFLGVIHLNLALGMAGFGPLLGKGQPTPTALGMLGVVVEHPGRVLDQLRSTSLNVRADLLSTGLLGLLWPPTLLVALFVPLEGALSTFIQFSAPGFQTLLVTLMMPVGTVAIVSLLSRSKHLASPQRIGALIALIAANAIAWAAVWFPLLSSTWLSIPAATASTLNHVLTDQIKPGDEVIASSGVMGRFGQRRYDYQLAFSNRRYPVRNGRVWVIFVPSVGYESSQAVQIYGNIAQLATQPHMQLVTAENGVWAFLYTPPAGTRYLQMSHGDNNTIAAWVVPGTAGQVVREGNAAGWYVRATGARGDVVASDRWQHHGATSFDRWVIWTGHYRGSAIVNAGTPAVLQVYDDTTHRVLASRTITAATGQERGQRRTVSVDFTVSHLDVAPLYAGAGAFSAQVQPTVSGDTIAIRVWNPGPSRAIAVYQVAIHKR